MVKMSGVRKKRWKGPLPVSAIQGVLLKDNRFAGMLLEDQMKQMTIDRRRAKNLLDWQQQSFLLSQAIKETELREMGVNHTSFLPEVTMKVTEPAVRARRPFGKVRRSASQMLEDLNMFEKRFSLPDLTTRRSRTLPEFSVSAPSLTKRKTTRDEEILSTQGAPVETTRSNFTQLHGIDLRIPGKSKTEIEFRPRRKQSQAAAASRMCGDHLPLYGPEAEAEREEKEKQYVRNLQRKMRELKVDEDDRFKRLEMSLVRDSPDPNESDDRLKISGLEKLVAPAGNKENTGGPESTVRSDLPDFSDSDGGSESEDEKSPRTESNVSNLSRLSTKSSTFFK
ncbi:uncharacterized protein LOC129262796 [Lytechinus pictus]|uniref:uncharacterized protein LOC129262796 n=1 Tax=Lytechinus pictus TaxID=7653 RepID=UPI0030B9B404